MNCSNKKKSGGEYLVGVVKEVREGRMLRGSEGRYLILVCRLFVLKTPSRPPVPSKVYCAHRSGVSVSVCLCVHLCMHVCVCVCVNVSESVSLHVSV